MISRRAYISARKACGDCPCPLELAVQHAVRRQPWQAAMHLRMYFGVLVKWAECISRCDGIDTVRAAVDYFRAVGVLSSRAARTLIVADWIADRRFERTDETTDMVPYVLACREITRGLDAKLGGD